jgi:hypothetical protein
VNRANNFDLNRHGRKHLVTLGFVSGYEYGLPAVGSSSSPAATPEHMLGTIGDIAISANWVVTPNGAIPITSVQWFVRDQSRTEESMPSYAIVLAIVFFIFCLLGLLFLLIKERRTTGYVEVGVQGPGLYHVAQIPISAPGQVAAIQAQVNWARGLAAIARR